MIINLKNKTGKSDVDCVKEVFGNMGAGESCGDIVDCGTTKTEGKLLYYLANNRGVCIVMRMKTKLNECEEYISVLEMNQSREERER